MTNIDDIIQPAKYHRLIVGYKLAQAREEMGLTQLAFSILCGWSRETQCKIERGNKDWKPKTWETIEKVLSERIAK